MSTGLAMEALNNAVKHAGATAVSVSLVREDGTLTLQVRDDGAGFDVGQPRPGHLGLHTMQERAAAAGATLRIDSVPGAGTTVTATVSCPPPQPPA